MALQAGNAAVLKLTDNGDSERTLSAYVTKLDLNFKGHTLADVTSMGDSGKTYASDELEDGTFSVEFMYDDGSNTVFDTLYDATVGLRTATSAKAFEIGPQGSSNGDPKFSGSCFLEDVSMPVAVGDMIRVTASFKVSGAVTVGSYTS